MSLTNALSPKPPKTRYVRKTVDGIRCPMCQEDIWSRNQHDLRWCKCGYCYVDGGREYLRVGWGGPNWAKQTPPKTRRMRG